MREVVLSPTDPTVFAKCPKCSAIGLGSRTNRIYNTAMTRRRWKKGPKCPNCGTSLVKLYEVRE